MQAHKIKIKQTSSPTSTQKGSEPIQIWIRKVVRPNQGKEIYQHFACKYAD